MGAELWALRRIEMSLTCPVAQGVKCKVTDKSSDIRLSTWSSSFTSLKEMLCDYTRQYVLFLEKKFHPYLVSGLLLVLYEIQNDRPLAY